MGYLLRLEEVRKSYPLGSRVVDVLKGINMEVEEGEFIAIMGPSGSGKSTLLNIIGCLDRPSSGRYWIGDDEVEGLPDDALARLRNEKIGFVFQNFNLLPRLPAWKNVELPLIYSGVERKRRKERAFEMLEKVGLLDRAEHHPTELSGGEQQRVAIARALINSPILLLADEPTGNLDSAAGRGIMEIFKALHEDGTTILLVTHEMEVARYSQRVVTIRDGICSEGCLV
ncbi:MAG: ABC transporter ATP-binding protein [Nitrospirae bacterium]|nr:MAG: ABC transporter ATP-binding protein [Nitrospirota bacterium]